MFDNSLPKEVASLVDLELEPGERITWFCSLFPEPAGF